MDNRAQSEALGFVFVFGIIVTTVAVVFAVGYPGLQNTQDFERVNNAERALTSLASSVDEQVQQRAPSRATELKLSDGTLTVVRADETIEISVDGTPVSLSHSETDTLVYDAGTGERLTYGNGLVSRTGPSGGTVLVRDPELVATSGDATVVTIPTLSAEPRSVGGDADVLIRTERGTSTVIEKDAGQTLTITVTSSRVDSWSDSLDDAGVCSTKTVTTETVSCEFDTTGKVYVTTVPIDLSFS